MKSYLIKNVKLNDKVSNIIIEKGLIKEINPEDIDADLDIFNAEGLSILPSLYNGHTHAGMAAFRGFGDDMALVPWLEEKIWPAEAKLTAEDIYWSTRFACMEMIRNGITFFSDMYWHRSEVVRAVKDSGMRARIPSVALDLGNPDKIKSDRRLIEEQFEKSKNDPDTIQFAIAPHAIYTVSKEQLQWIGQFAGKHDIPIHIHISETEREVKDSIRKNWCRPIEYIHSLGLLENNITLAHAVWVNKNELKLMENTQTAVISNPISNAKLGIKKIFPYFEYKKYNIPVSLGTDGVGANNSLNILNDMKFFNLLQKMKSGDATVLTAKESFSILTENSAKIFGINGGSIKVGQVADFMLIDTKELSMIPVHDLKSNMIYSESNRAIKNIVCNGEFLMKDSIIPEMEEVKPKIEQIAAKF